MRSGFARWVSPAPSGGHRYDAELRVGLQRLGVEITDVTVRADLDDPTAVRSELAPALPRERIWLIDAILAGTVPDLVAEAVAAGTFVLALVHHFGADAPELTASEQARATDRENRALQAASGVCCTSDWAVAAVRRRYGLDAVAAAPGVDRAPVAAGSRTNGAPRLLAIGSLTPIKDQLTLVAGLIRIRELAWTARLIGADTVDPAYAAVVRRAVRDAGLADRIVLRGPLTGAELDAEWAAANLLVQTSRSETYGLVVLEALARGIPAVVSAGTGLVEALQAGRLPGEPLAGGVVAAARPGDLAEALRRWCSDDDHASRWRSAALAQRPRLPSWSRPADVVLARLRRAAADLS